MPEAFISLKSFEDDPKKCEDAQIYNGMCARNAQYLAFCRITVKFILFIFPLDGIRSLRILKIFEMELVLTELNFLT